MKTRLTFVLATTLFAACLGLHNEATGQSALFSFDELNGPQLIDSQGNATASITGIPQFNIPGSYGTAVNFHGLSSMQVDYQDGLNPADEFSVSFWFKPTSFNSFDRLVDTTGSTGVVDQGYRICMGRGENSNNVMFIVRGEDGHVGVTHPQELRPGFWYYCVANYEGGCQLQLTVVQQSRNLTLAELVNSTVSTGARGPVDYSNQNNDVQVGAAFDGSSPFDGCIDELRLDDLTFPWWRMLVEYVDATPPILYTLLKVGSVPQFNMDPNSAGNIRVEVSSSDFWNLEDHGLMVDAEFLTGNFQIETRILNVNAGPFPWAKSGIMVRASGRPESTSAGIFFTSRRGAVFQSRPVPGGLTSRVVTDDLDSRGFVRLIRLGDSFYGAISQDGEKWESLGNFKWDQTPDTLIAGLAVAGQHDQRVVTRMRPPRRRTPTNQTGVFELSLIDTSAGQVLRSFHSGDVIDLDYYQNRLRVGALAVGGIGSCLLYTSPSPRDKRQYRMPSSA